MERHTVQALWGPDDCNPARWGGVGGGREGGEGVCGGRGGGGLGGGGSVTCQRHIVRRRQFQVNLTLN